MQPRQPLSPLFQALLYLQLIAKLQHSQHFHVEHHQRGFKVQSLHFSLACLILKHFCACHSVMALSVCPCLAGPEKENVLRPGNGSAQSLSAVGKHLMSVQSPGGL